MLVCCDICMHNTRMVCICIWVLGWAHYILICGWSRDFGPKDEARLFFAHLEPLVSMCI